MPTQALPIVPRSPSPVTMLRDLVAPCRSSTMFGPEPSTWDLPPDPPPPSTFGHASQPFFVILDEMGYYTISVAEQARLDAERLAQRIAEERTALRGVADPLIATTERRGRRRL